MLIGDGGGRVPSFPQPMVGGRRIAQLFFAGTRRFGSRHRIVFAELNGLPALLRVIDGQVESALCIETDGARIVRMHVQRNPAKLARIAAAHGTDPGQR
jgi:hypothetical protein